ncbi:MAG: hypothetical protein IKL08_05465 [Clostridia bacterium]|nr:hypothetical protein [Clostridia bacterium]
MGAKMKDKIESLILDIQYEADELCEYEDDSYQDILSRIEESGISKKKREMCEKILNDEPNLFQAYMKVIEYLEEE